MALNPVRIKGLAALELVYHGMKEHGFVTLREAWTRQVLREPH